MRIGGDANACKATAKGQDKSLLKNNQNVGVMSGTFACRNARTILTTYEGSSVAHALHCMNASPIASIALSFDFPLISYQRY